MKKHLVDKAPFKNENFETTLYKIKTISEWK